MNIPYISIIVPIVERHDDLEQLFVTYSQPLRDRNVSFEFIFVIDGVFTKAFETMKVLQTKYASEIRIIKFSRNFFESIALMVGFEHARGEYVYTLSAYFQVEPSAMTTVLDALQQGSDLVITRRFPREDRLINRLQTSVFHVLLRKITNFSFRDIACGLRGMKREVAKALNLTGDLHRFIPILAYQQGYKVVEVDAPQRVEDRITRFYGFGVYFRRVLDIITLFFLIKFTRKPLRFFGQIGVGLLLIGIFVTGVMGFERLFMGVQIGDRPLLLLGILSMVLGIQVASLGLLGELVIFTQARDLKEYHIAEIIE